MKANSVALAFAVCGSILSFSIASASAYDDLWCSCSGTFSNTTGSRKFSVHSWVYSVNNDRECEGSRSAFADAVGNTYGFYEVKVTCTYNSDREKQVRFSKGKINEAKRRLGLGSEGVFSVGFVGAGKELRESRRIAAPPLRPVQAPSGQQRRPIPQPNAPGNIPPYRGLNDKGRGDCYPRDMKGPNRRGLPYC